MTAKQMKHRGRRGEIRLKRGFETVPASENQTMEQTMISKIRHAMRRAAKRSRNRREYEFLMHHNNDQIFRDIGLTRADVARLYRQSRHI